MVKFKKGLSDKVRSKQKSKAKISVVNPFEIKVNKVKHSVVNKKVEKWEKGLPGVSRSKGIKKRKDTILNELRQMKKSNSLHDKRIGEKDSNLTPEEKMVQRFALERKMQTGKQNAFNLNEDEVVLTHYGQSLAENLKDRPASDSDDDDPYSSKVDTGKFQFGGFSLEADVPTWKDKMNEVIADSKRQKRQRQMEKEKSFEATIELDGLWKNVVTKMKPKTKESSGRRMSNFMVLSRTLVMEQRSDGAADKTKTEEQKAKEEAEKLTKLEAQRLERMRGEDIKRHSDHVSADSLSNGFALSQKGKSKVSFADDSDGESEKDENEEGLNDGGASDDEEEEGDSDDDSGSDEENGYSDLDDNEEEDDEDGEEDCEDGSDDESDKKKKSCKDNPTSILKKQQTLSIVSNPDDESVETGLPYVFEAPETYEDLETLLSKHTTSDQIITISRLRKCYHPSLAEGNKEKLQRIHLFLLQYFGEIVQGKEIDGKFLEAITTNLWELTQTFPDATAKFMQEYVLDRQIEYASLVERRGGRGVFPSVDVMLYLRLIEMLFPASDFRHEVTTPSIHFIAQMLAESSVRTLKDVKSGLYLCAVCLQYVHSSKRYVPEVITFLHGILYLASSSSNIKKLHPFPPFRAGNRESCHLELDKKCGQVSPQLSMSQIIDSDANEKDTNQLRCDLIGACINLIHKSCNIWNNLPCLAIIMKPIGEQLNALPSQFYPSVVKENIENVTACIQDAKKVTFSAMQHESKKPVPLALFEPRMQENWNGKRKKGGSNKDLNERQRLLHKHKREMKSAIREIKRDSAVVAQHKLEITMKKDAERKMKVKRILSNLADQEGDYRAVKKHKPTPF